jgi:LysR family transcriptional activator of mexEF-oprN operon
VSFKGDLSGTIDEVLKAMQRERQVVTAVARFSALPFLLAETAIMATLPEPVGYQLAAVHGLVVSPLPFAVPARSVNLLYRRRDAGDAKALWFRDLVKNTIQTRLIELAGRER